MTRILLLDGYAGVRAGLSGWHALVVPAELARPAGALVTQAEFTRRGLGVARPPHDWRIDVCLAR